jgi:hypothetical protein
MLALVALATLVVGAPYPTPNPIHKAEDATTTLLNSTSNGKLIQLESGGDGIGMKVCVRCSMPWPCSSMIHSVPTTQPCTGLFASCVENTRADQLYLLVTSDTKCFVDMPFCSDFVLLCVICG